VLVLADIALGRESNLFLRTYWREERQISGWYRGKKTKVTVWGQCSFCYFGKSFFIPAAHDQFACLENLPSRSRRHPWPEVWEANGHPGDFDAAPSFPYPLEQPQEGKGSAVLAWLRQEAPRLPRIPTSPAVEAGRKRNPLNAQGLCLCGAPLGSKPVSGLELFSCSP
jgi:hypothetical protein